MLFDGNIQWLEDFRASDEYSGFHCLLYQRKHPTIRIQVTNHLTTKSLNFSADSDIHRIDNGIPGHAPGLEPSKVGMEANYGTTGSSPNGGRPGCGTAPTRCPLAS